MTVEQHEARLAAIKAAFDSSTVELEKVQRAGQSVPRTTSSAFSQPKSTVSTAFIRPINKTTSFPPSRPAKRLSNPIDTDGSDDESSRGSLPPRKYRKTSNEQTAGGIAKPWDQDHSKMKKPPRMSLLESRGKPESTISSGKKKLKAPRASIRAQIELSAEQRGILDLVLQGQNVFFTGSAGKASRWKTLRPPDLFNRHWQVRITQAYYFRDEAQIFDSRCGSHYSSDGDRGVQCRWCHHPLVWWYWAREWNSVSACDQN